MIYLGDRAPDSQFSFLFPTQQADGTPITLAGTPSLRCYRNGVATETAAGLTLTVGFDTVTGQHLVAVNLAADAFYDVIGEYVIAIAAGTVDGKSVANRALATFSIGKPPGAVWSGTLGAIDATSITLPAGHGLDAEGNYVFYALFGTNARGKGRYLRYNSANKWDVDPAWTSDTETTPSGTVEGYIIQTAKVPTTTIAGVNALRVGGTVQTARDLGALIDVAVSTRLATAGYTAPANSDVTAIRARTDNLPTDPADQSLLIAATDAIISAIAALNDLGAADVLTALDTHFGTRIATSVAVNPGNTAVTFEVAASAGAKVYLGFCRFTSGNVAGESRLVTYTGTTITIFEPTSVPAGLEAASAFSAEPDEGASLSFLPLA